VQGKPAPGGTKQEATEAHPFAPEAIGTTPREWATWLLDGFAYRRLDSPTTAEASALWQALMSLIHAATDGGWTVAVPEPETVKVLTTADADQEWVKLPKRHREFLQRWPMGEEEVEVLVEGDAEGEPPRRETVRRGGSVRLVRPPDVRPQLRAAQRAVRGAVEAMVKVRTAVVPGRTISRRVSVNLIARRTGGLGTQAPAALSAAILASLRDAAVAAALAVLAKVPPALLRVCPWPPGGAPCGRVFVGVKRQKWCLAHQEDARLERERRAQQQLRARRERAPRGWRKKGDVRWR
jgi:hypothetical protein